MNEMLKQFNLPNFIDGLSFADASKKIQSKFKDRTDRESVETEKEMLGRLKQMQEHVKKEEEAKQEAQNPPREGDVIAGDQAMEAEAVGMAQEMMPEQEENQFAFGGEDEYYNPHAIPETAQQRFAPTMQANNQSIFSSLASIGKSVASSITPTEAQEVSGNKMYLGGPVNEGDSEYYSNNNPLFMQDQPAFSGVQAAKVDEPISSQVDAKKESGIGAKVSEGIGAASAAYSLGKQAFGDTGVDTSGATKVEPVKVGNAMMSGAAKGAQVGSAIGKYIPIPGAGLLATAATSVIGAGLGLIGANKQKKDAAIANRNSTYADAAVNDNKFANGGEENFFKKPKTLAEDLISGSRTAAKRNKPTSIMDYDAIEQKYKNFKNSKLDSISANNQVVPSGKYIKLSTGRNRGAEVDTALMDAVEAAEKRAGLRRGDIGTTINRESNYGGQSGAGMNYGKEVKKMGSTIDLLSMSNNYKGSDRYIGSEPLRHFADLKAPGVSTTKDFHGQYYQVTDKKLLDDYIRKNPKSVEAYSKKLNSVPYVKSKNSLDFLAEDMKKTGNTAKYRKEYNPGDPNYGNLMEQDAKDLSKEKAYNQYLDKNKFAMGGEEMNRFGGGGDENEYKMGRINPKTNKRIADKAIPSLTPTKLITDKKTIYTGKEDGDRDLLSNYTAANKLGIIKMPSLGRKDTKMTSVQKIKLAGIEAAEAIGKNKEALRYAPALGNLMQLAKLKKATPETTREINTRYKPQFTDEAALSNLVREETNSTREAILGSSEGSGGSARANLLGAQLNSTKALSDAYMRSAEQNNAERRQEQAFNLSIEDKNMGQSNLAQDIRAKNEGVYESEKSRLQSAIASDLGSIGQEELYKKFPELMGADYNWKGKYKKTKNTGDTA